MFFEITDELRRIEAKQIDPKKLTVGYLTAANIGEYAELFGLDEETVEESKRDDAMFRTGVDVKERYTFSKLRIVKSKGREAFISMYVMENMFLFVDIVDKDGTTGKGFREMLENYPAKKFCLGRVIGHFFASLVTDGNQIAEILRNELTEMEESIVKGTADKEFNANLLTIKRRILRYFNYCSQLLDIAEALEENENDVLEDKEVRHISNAIKKIERLRDEINALDSIADHIQDAYSTLLDQRMNSTMKVFTVITTIFFPLTIVVGWYGMNFVNMPELTWEYGYLYVIGLSVLVVAGLVVIGRRNKWF